MEQPKRPSGYATMEEIRLYLRVSRTTIWKKINAFFPDHKPHERLKPYQVKKFLDSELGNENE